MRTVSCIRLRAPKQAGNAWYIIAVDIAGKEYWLLTNKHSLEEAQEMVEQRLLVNIEKYKNTNLYEIEHVFKQKMMFIYKLRVEGGVGTITEAKSVKRLRPGKYEHGMDMKLRYRGKNHETYDLAIRAFSSEEAYELANNVAHNMTNVEAKVYTFETSITNA